MRYYLGPWRWVERGATSHFAPPPFAHGAIDFGTLAEMSKPGSDRPGCLLVTDAVLPSEYTLLGEGMASEIKIDGRVKSIFSRELNHAAEGDSLADLIRDTLQNGEVDGGTKWKPLMPDARGWMDVHLGGCIQSERFEWGKPGSRGGNHTPRMQAMLRAEFRQHFDNAKAGRMRSEHHRRILDWWCEKYGLNGPDDWRQLVPQDLQAHVPGRLKHETTITDDFTRADGDTIGNLLSWSEVTGDLDTVSNAVQSGVDGSVGAARAESDLSSEDHYSQINVTALGNNVSAWAPLTRFAAAATTFYSGETYRTENNSYLLKTVANVRTLLAGPQAVTPAAPQAWKLTSNGSSQALSQAGTDRVTVTDTSITGNVRCGIWLFYNGGTSSTIDDFEAADLGGGGGILFTQLERSTRGLVRGVYGSN